MCGILGMATVAGRSVKLSDEGICRLRELLSHRGPDGAGLWRSAGSGGLGVPGQFVLAHRRLAVIDLSPAGAQPMVLDDPALGERGRERYALIYNGELYNDEELRQELRAQGACFRSLCDTETLLHALVKWGPEGVERLRGMFAFAMVDQVRNTLLIGRDAMGIKPLFYHAGLRDVIVASEPGPILEHPEMTAKPDLVGISAYFTTIRRTMGERTLFEGVKCLRAGEVVEFRLDGNECVIGRRWFNEPSPQPPPTGRGGRGPVVRDVIEDSVRRHLRADVATCSLLSGGLDSSIIVAIAREHSNGELRTYCSGHDDQAERGDLAYAEMVGAHFGTVHTAAAVTEGLFRERWPEMVRRLGVPLSTPNEVAINEVARRLRADGQVVALSGEGADELFGGYELPMRMAFEFEERRRQRGIEASGHEEGEAGGAFQLMSNAWMTPEVKAEVFRPEVWRGLEEDSALYEWYAEEFDACARLCGGSGLQAHLTFHRRVNLAGLLARLDTATMLEGVEGRTPFADTHVCAMAERMPMSEKYQLEGGLSRTKIALRESFRAMLPESVVVRPKASFPLPFQAWMKDSVSVVGRSEFARTLFRDAAIAQVMQSPGTLWNLAWPMINLAMWGERWWPMGSRSRPRCV